MQSSVSASHGDFSSYGFQCLNKKNFFIFKAHFRRENRTKPGKASSSGWSEVTSFYGTLTVSRWWLDKFKAMWWTLFLWHQKRIFPSIIMNSMVTVKTTLQLTDITLKECKEYSGKNLWFMNTFTELYIVVIHCIYQILTKFTWDHHENELTIW